MEVDTGSNQKSDIQPHSITAHACLKCEFTEYEKYNLPHEMAQISVPFQNNHHNEC